MVNVSILRAWPNYFLIPAMLAFWVIFGALAAEAIGAKSYREH